MVKYSKRRMLTRVCLNDGTWWDQGARAKRPRLAVGEEEGEEACLANEDLLKSRLSKAGELQEPRLADKPTALGCSC